MLSLFIDFNFDRPACLHDQPDFCSRPALGLPSSRRYGCISTDVLNLVGNQNLRFKCTAAAGSESNTREVPMKAAYVPKKWLLSDADN